MTNFGTDLFLWASTNGMTFSNPFFIMLALFALGGVVLGFPFLRGLFGLRAGRAAKPDKAEAQKELLD